MNLIQTARVLRLELRDLRFAAPVAYVYSPLEYAWNNHRIYLERFGARPREAVLIGMNPGPWGMMQTGVPFGDASMVRDWLGIIGAVDQPRSQHPARPVLGFDCARGEVSGQRLWGWAQQRYGTADGFFARYFVLNYCPLAFLEASGRNRTPDNSGALKDRRCSTYAIGRLRAPLRGSHLGMSSGSAASPRNALRKWRVTARSA